MNAGHMQRSHQTVKVINIISINIEQYGLFRYISQFFFSR